MKAIASFIEKGLLESAGKGPSTDIGGKKPELFKFCMQRYLLCVGLWRDEMVASLYDLTNTLLAQERVPYNMQEEVTQFLDMLEIAADHLFAKVKNGKELLYGVSLFVGGILDNETGVLKYSVLTPDWGYNVPLKELLKQRFPEKEIVIDNVARMAACAAVLDDPVYEKKRVAVIYTDVGASACYIDQGHVQHGPHSLIGEIGPMIVALTDTKPYTTGQESFFSTKISEETICRKVLEQPEKLKKSILGKCRGKMTLKQIFLAAEQEDGFAKQIVREAAWTFSALLHNVMLNFDPEIVIIQGDYAYAGEWFNQCIKEGMACFPGSMSAVPFELVYDRRPLISLQMMGATKILMQKFFTSKEWL